jgi:hypothetical protein
VDSDQDWYWPAAQELQAAYGHCPDRYCPAAHVSSGQTALVDALLWPLPQLFDTHEPLPGDTPPPPSLS